MTGRNNELDCPRCGEHLGIWQKRSHIVRKHGRLLIVATEVLGFTQNQMNDLLFKGVFSGTTLGVARRESVELYGEVEVEVGVRYYPVVVDGGKAYIINNGTGKKHTAIIASDRATAALISIMNGGTVLYI